MDLQSALERLQTAIQEWQIVYATSPSLRLRQQVAALQGEAHHIQEQYGKLAGTVSVPVPAAGCPRGHPAAADPVR